MRQEMDYVERFVPHFVYQIAPMNIVTENYEALWKSVLALSFCLQEIFRVITP